MRIVGKGTKRLPRKLQLGKDYEVMWISSRPNPMTCRFIQPTRCGFNFLDLETNKCILKNHLYPSKAKGHESGEWFWINTRLLITEWSNSKYIRR